MRRLDTRPVPEELLLKLVDAANQAPSGSNLQNGRWIVVRDPSVKSELAALNRAGVESYLAPQMDSIEPLPHQSADHRLYGARHKTRSDGARASGGFDLAWLGTFFIDWIDG